MKRIPLQPKRKPLKRGPWTSASFVIEYRGYSYSVHWTHWECIVTQLGAPAEEIGKHSLTYRIGDDDKPRVTDSLDYVKRYVASGK